MFIQYIVGPKVQWIQTQFEKANQISLYLAAMPLVPVLMRMRYALEREPLPYDTSKIFFGCGVLYSVKCFVEAVRHIKSHRQRKTIDIDCCICMEHMSYCTAFSCGHMSCWTCACEWVQKQAECPICRETTALQDLIVLSK